MKNDSDASKNYTQNSNYSDYLLAREGCLWKRVFKVQLPYRLHLWFLNTGKTLDVGCGIGRNLAFLKDGFGVDHNLNCVDICRLRGFSASLPEDFHAAADDYLKVFDTIFFSHVLEHMSLADAKKVLMEYLPYLKSGGRIIILAPQEAGYFSDHTHVSFFDFEAAEFLLQGLGANVVKKYSFPFPRFFGRFFKYNEFVTISEISI